MTNSVGRMGAESAGALLGALRQGASPAADAARARLAYAGAQAERDGRGQLRAEVASGLGASLGPSDEALARWLLEQEIAAHEARQAGASEALYTLVAALARFGRSEDALLIWRAREATPETRAGVDVEQLARAGVASTRAALERLAGRGSTQSPAARRALGWFNQGAAEGAFDDLPGYFLWADERFGLTVSGPT